MNDGSKSTVSQSKSPQQHQAFTSSHSSIHQAPEKEPGVTTCSPQTAKVSFCFACHHAFTFFELCPHLKS